MDYAGQFTGKPDDGDSLGRAAWGLCYLCAHWSDDGPQAVATDMLQRLWAVVPMSSPRTLAYCCAAAREYLRAFPDDGTVRGHLKKYASRLAELYDNVASDRWCWFENVLTYGNAIIPYGILTAYDLLREPRLAEIGRQSLDFLVDVTLSGDYLDVVGNNGWYPRGGTRARFDQQPIDAGYMVLALDTAAEVLGTARYRELSLVAGQWFLGRNVQNEPLYDVASGGCRDGIEPDGINQNMGAESTVVCLIALLRLHRRRLETAPDHLPASR